MVCGKGARPLDLFRLQFPLTDLEEISCCPIFNGGGALPFLLKVVLF